jgi:hypothetical protein
MAHFYNNPKYNNSLRSLYWVLSFASHQLTFYCAVCILCFLHWHIPRRSHTHFLCCKQASFFIRLPHSSNAWNNNLDCFIKQSNIFTWRLLRHLLFVWRHLLCIFYNFQALLNHRANACSCFPIKIKSTIYNLNRVANVFVCTCICYL